MPYHNLKGKNLVRFMHKRGCMKFKPVRSGREEGLPSTDEGELNAISRAVRHGEPLYFIRSSDGSTLDVSLNRENAIKMRDAVRARLHNGGPRVDVYERRATALIRL